LKHNFTSPFYITAEQIKQATTQFEMTNQREVRILCKQDSREDRPKIFKNNNLFILPTKNGQYAIIRGEGYVDIPEITSNQKIYNSKLNFKLETTNVGNSEMQHLDFAYAASLIRTFLEDDSLVLTIRGRKYTPKFSFFVGSQQIDVESVQTEVDAGYEGKNLVALIEAKNSQTHNVVIRQLFYPYRQWSSYTNKKVIPLFFEKRENFYSLWQFLFTNPNDYNSIKLVKSSKFEIVENI
jgi:hypothetical protein